MDRKHRLKSPETKPKSKYEIAAIALRHLLEYNMSLKEINILKGEDLSTVGARELTKLAFERRKEINYLLKKEVKLTADEHMDSWIVRILIADLLWGKQFIKTKLQMMVALRDFEEDLRESFVEVSTIIRNPADKDKSLFPTYVRINTLSISIESSLKAFAKEGWDLMPRCETYLDHLKRVKTLKGNNFIRDFHIYELFIFPPGTSFYEHPGYLKGKFLIQDKGSCLSSFLLNPKPGSVVLDMCAAIGFKTNHLANIMNNEGLIHAIDIDEERMDKMMRMMVLTDVKCMRGFCGDCLKFNEFDDVRYILIDPSCTYSGLFLAADRSYFQKRIRNTRIYQNAMLRYALSMFPNVKRIVYTVCSLCPEEGIDNISQILNDIGESYTLLNVRKMLWKEWFSVSRYDYECSYKCLQIKPEFDLCQGYFIAVFERNFDLPVPSTVQRTEKDIRIQLIHSERSRYDDHTDEPRRYEQETSEFIVGTKRKKFEAR